MTNKPATESTCAQGISFIEELSFSDQNCNCHLFSLSAPFPQYPGSWALFLLFYDGNINPG